VKSSLHGDKPIYLQIKERIEDQILQGDLKEGDQIPSTNEMVRFYKVNHLTVAKGMNLLAEAGIIFKKRGVGMFVDKGAKEKLLEERKEHFQDQYIFPLLREAAKIGLKEEDLIKMIGKSKEKEENKSENRESIKTEGE